jgi:hypothetical protein
MGLCARTPHAEKGSIVAAVRLLFVVSGRAGVWSAPGLEPEQREINLDGWCAWRLVGANNREIARSARTFPTFHECYQAARQVQQRLALAVTTVRHDDVLNLWAWRAQLDGVPVATSGRLYQRHRECQSNVAQFLALMPLAATAYDTTVLPTLDGERLDGDVIDREVLASEVLDSAVLDADQFDADQGFDDVVSTTLRLV